MPRLNGATVPIATKLILSYLLVIAITVLVVSVVGTRLIGDIIMTEAQATVRNDLNAAREILLGRLVRIDHVVRLSAERFFLKDALRADRLGGIAAEMARVRAREGLDFLTLTDAAGTVLLRAGNPGVAGDDRSRDDLIAAARFGKQPAAAVAILSADDLGREAAHLAAQAYFRLVETPRARPWADTEQTAGMVLAAAAPVLDEHTRVLGVLYGGVLVNRNFELVDKIKQTVFQEVKHNGREIGTSTIFQDDVRISTNVTNADGSRAIGTRVAEEVYDQVVVRGRPWIGRAYVVTDWYITAYEPIQNINHRIIGMLYVGVLENEKKYVAIRRRAVGAFLAMTLAGGLAATGLSYLITRRVSASVRTLVSASHQVARGNLTASADVRTRDELQDLAETFNAMAAALRARDERIREFTHRKLMESERLAIVGQLAAGVAHELNNPLQGIVAYTHLLLEQTPAADPAREPLQKVVTQADRCRETIRGLLDFSRPRPPQKTPSDLNQILGECLALVENQALFHNIEVARALQDDLPRAVVDPAQMQQVCMNLIMNAAEAMDGAGRLTVATRSDADHRRVEVEVTDTGHGIRPEDLERIFDPFFTTKGIGRGTGLGLSICYGIVREHRGTISVESEVGRGASFTVRLPVSEEEA